jgi:hypothetical protein
MFWYIVTSELDTIIDMGGFQFKLLWLLKSSLFRQRTFDSDTFKLYNQSVKALMMELRNQVSNQQDIQDYCWKTE